MIDFAVKPEHRVNRKQVKSWRKRTKKIWNMRMTVVHIIIGTLGKF